MKRLIALAMLWPSVVMAQTATSALTTTPTALPSQDQSISPPRAVLGAKPCAIRKTVLRAMINSKIGSTGLTFTIAADGSVKNLVVTQSSGSDATDQAAVDCASQWKYFPAMKDGQPIDVPWKTTIQWHRN